MIVKRAKLNLWERLYLPAIIGGFRVTVRHFFKKKVTLQYPEEKWTVPECYRGAPYLVKDQQARTKCVSCQLCEFVCPPKAIRIVPPGPSGAPEVGNVEKAPKEFEINMLRCIFCGYCQEVCPEEAIFLMKDYSLTGTSRDELIYNKEKLLVYAGAVIVLFLFVIMLLDLKAEERRKVKKIAIGAGLVCVGAILGILLATISHTQIDVQDNPLLEGGTVPLGSLLFKQYLLPFEIVSILLLVAMVGVVLLSKKDLK